MQWLSGMEEALGAEGAPRLVSLHTSPPAPPYIQSSNISPKTMLFSWKIEVAWKLYPLKTEKGGCDGWGICKI